MTPLEPLDAQKLYRHCNIDQFDFDTTDDLDDLRDIVAQPRAVEAVQFGVGIQQEGYNIYVMGSSGTGKQTLVQKYFGEAADERSVPDDLCYVNDFEHSHQPNHLRLPAGMAVELQQDMEDLVENLQTVLPTAFESDEYRQNRREIEEEVNTEQEQVLENLREKANERDLRLMRTPAGLVFAPIKDGEVVPPDEFQKLEDDERERIEQDIEELQSELEAIVQDQPRLQREVREHLEELKQEVAARTIEGLIEELREKYSEHDHIVAYLDAVEQDVIENVDRFLPSNGGDNNGGVAAMMQAAQNRQNEAFFKRYQVNVIVDHSDTQGAPVVYENNPTYQNLLGRIEHIPQMGALTTDFTLIKGGALHRANGGYLILDARKLLLQPFAWEGLKRALEASCIRIESPRQMAGLISTVSLEPDPIQLDVKIALLGDRRLYYLLEALEPEFSELFKVQADFDERTERDDEHQHLYARLIASLVKKNDLQPFDRTAVARVIERASRMAGDQSRLTTHVRKIDDLLAEADYWAGENGHDVVTGEDVQRAIDAQVYRADRMRERSQESILEDTILIDTEGEEVGQINGLSVLQLGNFAFGRPSRITARVRLGEGEVVNIEREVDMSGAIHSKGVLIMAGYLGAKYAAEQPLSLSASLVFEQSYSGVDGDSASSTELYALLSAIAEIPLKQSLAVTGSINQRGDVQAIGGVNEKIEGFFDICRERGLTGDQGVLIPQANVKHLMLRQDVREAVEAGDFHIYPVAAVDEGIELLTGIEAGQPDADGKYPPESVNGRVKAALAEMSEARAAFARSMKASDG